MALAEKNAVKNKLMEMTGMELQKMRINLQKLWLQSWNLAKSNSHILAMHTNPCFHWIKLKFKTMYISLTLA
ncbi:hypothetical protein NMG60_11024068 [Bertholletia excelsa]